VYEEKLDGYRMLAYRDRKRIRLVSRNGVDHTRRFPELAATVGTLRSSSLVRDAEVAIFDRQLRSRFEWPREPAADVASPPLVMVFDLLYRAGHDLSRRPLHERRERLEERTKRWLKMKVPGWTDPGDRWRRVRLDGGERSSRRDAKEERHKDAEKKCHD
jgi:ATP-dependent DNA ligase